MRRMSGRVAGGGYARAMRAIVYERYGQPLDVLELREVPRPVPTGDEVLIRVVASSVNSWDCDLVYGRPWISRMEALRRPKHRILGCDVAGVVEALGPEAKRFRVGDEVFGDISGRGWGAFAEYVSPREDVLAAKPAGVSFTDAAAVLALQALRAGGGLASGRRVLFNGAGGGVGTLGIQMATAAGATVTGVDRGEKLAAILEAGADSAIDYTREDFTQGGERYDAIVDVSAFRSVLDCRRVLTEQGRYVVVGGATSRIAQTAALQLWGRVRGGRRVGLLLHRPNADDLAKVGELVASGTVVPVVEHVYALAEVPEAVRRLRSGEVCGKLVISV